MFDSNLVSKGVPEPDMKEYYNFRSLMYNLYDNDDYYGDLCGSVLHIRDKNRCINSMSTSIQNEHHISVEFDESTSSDKMIKIAHQISEKIEEFIQNNKGYLVEVNKDKNLSPDKLDKFLSCSSFCDKSIVGKTLEIML